MLKEVFDSISIKMSADFSVSGNINHNGEKGNAREDTFVKYLKTYIPEKFNFSKGIIIDSNDTQSRQVDVIIHDKFNSSIIFETDTTTMIPIETVYCVVEIKSTLTKAELLKSLKNIESVRRLKKCSLSPLTFPTAGLVFAYTADSSLDALYHNVVEFNNSIDIQNQVSCICVLDKGLIVPVKKKGMNQLSLIPSEETVFAQIDNKHDSLLLFYLMLIQLLNQIKVYPPNMIQYAQKSGMIPTQFIVPMEFTPMDAELNFMDKMIKMKDIDAISKNSKRFFDGKVKKEEYLDVFFAIIIPTLEITFGNLSNISKGQHTISYFGENLDLNYLYEMYLSYNNALQGNINEKEMCRLDEFKNLVWKNYVEGQNLQENN